MRLRTFLSLSSMASIFTQIIRGEIPAYKVAEDVNHLAFLDISPLARGHTLVIPKREVDYIFDLVDEDLAKLNVFAKTVAVAIKKAIPCERIGITVIGLEVPHAHIHLIPLHSIHDMEFSRPKLTLPASEMEQIANSIREHLS